MGFESKISGYIASHRTDKKGVEEIQSKINQLPNLEEDEWPFLPKDIFCITKPISNSANHIQICYRSTMIHFSMSVKQLDYELQEWIEKFSTFFKSVPGVYEVNLDISLAPYTNNNNTLKYYWELNRTSKNEYNWIFQGDPTDFNQAISSL